MEAGKLTHSHSQPGGMDRTPPGTPRKGGKMLAVRVQMLDDTITMFQIQAKALGRVLFEQVCNQLHLLESDYFGLEYQELGGTKYWLDLEKPLSRQIGLSLVDTLVRFCVKFYTPDPSQLEEEFTRYLFCLQIKRDLSQGLLQCNSNTAALLASYIVQAECGDYVAEDYPDHRYLSSYKFVPNQDQEIERRIMENHKKHAGQSPAEADLNLLETARRCELYGIKMHPAKNHEGAPLNLAVAHMGIVIFQNFTKINTFSWAKIRKISFKRKRFLVKLHPEGYGHYKDTVEFFFEGRNECKNFWKKCVENHGFFRCSMVKKVPRQKTRVLSRGSSFRYSGRTQKQIVDFVRENYVKRQTFQRSQSFRHSTSAHSSVANVGTSISAHPLLPLGDNAVAGTPASLSCGSMTLTSSPLHTADIHAEGSPSPPLTTSVSPGTSVTSSPQHFYPQETPFRRAGHQPTKMKHPHVHSQRAISPLQSPTDAATSASSRSANLSNSNNNNIVDGNDVKSSRVSLRSPDYINFNDVYSTCYSSLRSSRSNVAHKIIDEEIKTDIFNLPDDYLIEKSSNDELIRPTNSHFHQKEEDVDRYTWHRSASCKDLYRDERELTKDKNEINMQKTMETECETGLDFPVTRYDNSRRKCYSAVTSKNPSMERSGSVITDMKMYSSSYPGTTSSLSTESAEIDPEDRIMDIVDVKYDSQEETAMSHDDVSHDSYELLERELAAYNEELSRAIRDSDRTRSCSWGSDRGMSPFDSKSTENVVSSGFGRSGEDSFWMLERERSPKHKSETDFRSLNYKISKSYKTTNWNGDYRIHVDENFEKRGIGRDFSDYDNRRVKRLKEGNDSFEMSTETVQTEARIFSSNNFEKKALYRNFDRESRLQNIENLENYERRKYQDRRKSLEEVFASSEASGDGITKERQFRFEERRRAERKRDRREKDERFHEGIKEKEQKEWEREREKRQMERRKNLESKGRRNEEDLVSRKISPKPKDFGKFQEIQPSKLDGVGFNQFSQFPSAYQEQDFLAQERKVLENYEKICQVGKIAKELKENERSSVINLDFQNVVGDKSQEFTRRFDISDNYKVQPCDTKDEIDLSLMTSPKANLKLGKALVERTKSDPYNSLKNQRRNILTHQKSIDLTPQQSEDTSDLDNEEGFKKTSRSEHDIPYILHKRHFMNGTAKNTDLALTKTDLKTFFDAKNERKDIKTDEPVNESKKLAIEDNVKKLSVDASKLAKPKPPPRGSDLKKSGVQIINLDVKNDASRTITVESKKIPKGSKPLAKKSIPAESKVGSPKSSVRKDVKKAESPKVTRPAIEIPKKDGSDSLISKKPSDSLSKSEGKSKEPIYAEVCKEKIPEKKTELFAKKPPPEPPKRTSSVLPKMELEKKIGGLEKKDKSGLPQTQTGTKSLPKPPKRTTSMPKSAVTKAAEGDSESKISKPTLPKPTTNEQKNEKSADKKEPEKPQKLHLNIARGKPDLPVVNSVLQRREESLILFARTRLGLSEGSAFAPIVRQGHVGSPASQRRTKSLDAPYVSVHSLPPVDSFSSKDDTVDNSEGDVVQSAVSRAKELFKAETKKASNEKILETKSNELVTTLSTESEMDSAFLDGLELESNFKKTVESQSKIDVPYVEEKVLDGVRSKRLLSKIESVDVVDSEADMDSSKMADPLPIPADRLVNLPESVRFPSVRQISGQTSEESADGWDQKEVKVKRRAPRRSVGREEPENEIKESVVWDSKDDEPPDDDVWDDNLVFTGKYENSAVTEAVAPVEYLKRGSCGQSIDDDNLSTPMKESSPEHWVSVDDLPEALEREEKLLRQQEKILREKILNEKLKRELNLDTIDVDDKYYEYKDNFKSQKYETDLKDSKDKFKGHSLDTYELNEKRVKERGTVKNSSLDEHLLGDKLIKNYSFSSSLTMDDKSSYVNVIGTGYQEELDYIQCKVVNDVSEIDQFEDNDEELEEFFVVLDENLGNEKDEKNVIWEEDNSFRRTVSKDDSLISVPEEFKDVEQGNESLVDDKHSGGHIGGVEIRFSEVEERNKKFPSDEENLNLREKLDLMEPSKIEGSFPVEKINTNLHEGKTSEDLKLNCGGEIGRLSPYGGSRRGSEEHRKPSTSEDTGRLSPYDYSSRRSSEDPRRLSTSDDAGRLSPFSDSRRGSEDPRRLSASEDSRKYSMSESVSEETRRRLSSTEETRRKRASLTKQCSVGADSLSDDMISGIQECSSSFEQDEKDVFEGEATIVIKREDLFKKDGNSEKTGGVRHLEIEVFEDISCSENKSNVNEEVTEPNGTTHLAPPTNERELSRETEDSVDYCEGDFKDIREAVKEKDISEGLICDNEPADLTIKKPEPPSSFEKSGSSEGDDFHYIDEKVNNASEILVGKSKEAVAMSIVVINEGISVLNRISKTKQWVNQNAKAHSLPREAIVSSANVEQVSNEERHTLPKKFSKPPLTLKPVDHQKKMAKTFQGVEGGTYEEVSFRETLHVLKNSLDSSQESDIDKLSDISLLFHVQSQITKRNLSDTGKSLKREKFFLSDKENMNIYENIERKISLEEEALIYGHRTSSEEREKTESSSFEIKSSADEFALENEKLKELKGDKKVGLKSSYESGKGKKDSGFITGKGKRSPEQEKRDSGEDGSSSSSAPPYPKRELSSTWKPFLLESSGSSSLEEGWLPPDDNAHLADEEETSSTSNNQQDDSYHDDIDYPTGIGYPVLSMSTSEMMVGGYSNAYVLSRTLSRISERSTSEQERSDMDDDITKPSSHSASAEEESIMSSDHQPSLSSDPPSPREITSGIPDLPDDRPLPESPDALDGRTPVCEPFRDIIPPPIHDDDWPSPPSSSSVIDTPVVSHIETFYLEIHPEEACKVVVAEPLNEGNSSSDENQTLHEESEFLHLSSDNVSQSTTTTTQDGTVIVPVRPKSVRTGSVSEDTSMISTSDWSSSVALKIRSNQNYGTSEDLSEWMKNSQDLNNKVAFKHSNDDISDWSSSTSQKQSQSFYAGCEEAKGSWSDKQKHPSDWPTPSTSKYYSESNLDSDGQKPKISPKIKPPKLISPPTKNIGFFETPVSKVRSPTSQKKFFESVERGHPSLRSPTSHSESASPKNFGRGYDSGQLPSTTDVFDFRPIKVKQTTKREKSYHTVCTPYYSNVADSAEKSYFGRYDTGSLERTKIHSSRKCCSYYSVSKVVPHDSDGSNSEEPPPPSSNTIPRAAKKTKKRHRVAMDLEIRDGKIVAPPKTMTTVIDNSDSDRSSPREFATREENANNVSDISGDALKNNNVLSSTPIQNGKSNGEVILSEDGGSSKSIFSPQKSRTNQPIILSDLNIRDQNINDSPTKSTDSFSGQNTLDTKVAINNNRNTLEGTTGETEIKKKRFNADRGYFILKELLSTERTYKKDLDVINIWFHEEVSKTDEEMPDDVLNGLFNLFDPLSAAHLQFLVELEQRLSTWENKTNILPKKDTQKIGDVLLNHFNVLPLYVKYLDKHLLILERLDAAFRKNKKFEQVYRDFELQRVCYLPLSSFVMKPLQRLLHYNNILKRLIKHYGPDHIDYNDFSAAQDKLAPIIENVPATLKVSENFIQLSELQRDMPSFEGLLQGGREFIRQGCLLKHSKKGFQQRMFFLFSDILVYTNRTTIPNLQFKVNGQMPLRGVMVEESEDRIGTNFSFTIYGGNRTLTVAANSQEEKDKWLADLFEAIQNARERNDGKVLQYLSLKSCSSSDEIMDKLGEDSNANRNRNSQQRSNTTVHVCWHRNTSTSLQDHLRAFENELSGFLLRKFKNSNGWQKLWVVFTNFCLFFYKAYLDEAPLASLPLLGYTITVPDDEDDIRKDFVFKLQFKNHVYFFRAESDYTFSRWMEVISSATKYSCKTKSLTTKDNPQIH